MLVVHEVLYLGDEPLVYLGLVADFVHGAQSAFERLVYHEEAVIGGGHERIYDLLVIETVVFGIVEAVTFAAAHRFHERLLEGGRDRHDLARRLHLRAERALRVHEFVERPPRQLDDHIVESGLEAGFGLARDDVGNFVEVVAERNERGDLGYGVARRFGSERGRARNAGIDLDDRIFHAVRFESELAVAAAFHAQRGDDVKRGSAQHLIFPVGKRDAGRDDYAVAGVYAHGVEVLHRADGYDVAGVVAHDLELYLFPARDAFFDEHLRDRRQVQSARAAPARRRRCRRPRRRA